MTNKELKQKWRLVLEKSSTQQNKAKVNTWFTPLEAYKVDEENKILILASDGENTKFIKGLINNNKGFILPYVEEVFGQNFDIQIIDPNNVAEINKDNTDIEKELGDELYKEFINPTYSFERFICGGNNRLALAVSLAVAEKYSEDYNPLFIYGGSGLGKTHLLHAIANSIQQSNIQNSKEKRSVLYVSSENFTNEYIDSARKNNMNSFRDKYRNVDVLLIDDVQFIAGKKETTEELFHIFEHLKNSGKQLVFSSDKSPKELDGMPERLTSRFAWGITADIQPPDFETRVAILNQKAETEGFVVDKDFKEVIELIAQNITSNIRDLEGVLNRVIAQATLLNKNITKELTKNVLTDIFTTIELEITPSVIKKKVASYFGIKISDIEGPKRTKNLTYPRQVAMYLMRNYTDLSLPQIGDEFGGRDHTTVMHSIEKITIEIEENNTLKDSIEKIKSSLSN